MAELTALVGISGQYLLDHFTMNVGQTKIPPAVTVGQSFVIESQQVQDSGVQIVHVDFIGDCPVSIFVGFAVGHSAANAAARHPNREALR